MTNVLLTGSLESFIQLLGALFIFAVVLAATYLTTRWMGGMQRGVRITEIVNASRTGGK